MLLVEPEHIARLRREIAGPAALEAAGSRTLGVPEIDAALGGGWRARRCMNSAPRQPTSARWPALR